MMVGGQLRRPAWSSLTGAQIQTCVIGAQYSTAYRHGRPLTREQLILVLLLAMDAFAHSKPGMLLAQLPTPLAWKCTHPGSKL